MADEKIKRLEAWLLTQYPDMKNDSAFGRGFLYEPDGSMSRFHNANLLDLTEQLASKDGLLQREKASASATKQKLEQELKEKDKQLKSWKLSCEVASNRIKELEALQPYYGKNFCSLSCPECSYQIAVRCKGYEALEQENAALRKERDVAIKEKTAVLERCAKAEKDLANSIPLSEVHDAKIYLKQIAALTKERDELKTKCQLCQSQGLVYSLRGWNELKKDEIADLKSQLEGCRQSLLDLKDQLKQYEQTHKATCDEIGRLEKRIEKALAILKAHKATCDEIGRLEKRIEKALAILKDCPDGSGDRDAVKALRGE